MTADFFERQIERLKPLGAVSDEFKEGYWDALRDIPADVFDAAIGHALKTRAWFPKPVELRADADAVASQTRPIPEAEDRTVALAQPFTITVPNVGTIVPVTREWKYYDDTCGDGGWESVWCGDRRVHPKDVEPYEIAKPWQRSLRCDRRGDHDAHEWVKHCGCWDTNPALIRKREAQRKYAEKPQRA